jgi:hypothetical protein
MSTQQGISYGFLIPDQRADYWAQAAVVGISAEPGFVAGLKAQGLELFPAGIVVTTVPLVLLMS